MLTDEQIDELIQPIIDRQTNISNYVIKTIANKINKIGTMSPSDIKKLKLLFEMGEDIREINKALAELTNLQVKDIKAVIKIVAVDAYIDAKPFYDYRHKSFIPFEKNTKLQSLVTAIGNATAETYKNISDSRATGFLIRDPKHPQRLKFYSIKDTYKTVIDEAVQAVKGGTVDYETAVRRTVRQLSESGIRKLYWDSGYTQRLDTAVRRNILGGISAINQGIQQEIGKQINADGIELSAHVNSALDHEPIQGHAFTNKEFEKLQSVSAFEDIYGNKFDAIERAIGTWNCRHYTKAIVIDAYKPKYSIEQLNDFISRNHAGYTTEDGKHLTLYECTQYQRHLETKIRQAKDSQIAFRESGDIREARKYQARINRYMEQYKRFSTACGLKQKINRTRVYKYRKIKAYD